MDSSKNQTTHPSPAESAITTLNLLEQIYRRDERLLWLQQQNKKLSDHLMQEQEKLALQLDESEGKIQMITEQKNQELQAIYATRGWRFILFLRNLREKTLPIGSKREKILKWAIGTPIKLILHLRFAIKNLLQNLKKAYYHARQYGVFNMLKLAIKKLFPISTRLLQLSTKENYLELPAEREKIRPLLLMPMPVFLIPDSKKRINLVVETLDTDTVSTMMAPIIFALLLSEKWESQLRIITRLQVATKLEIYQILKNNGIAAPDIEFLYIQAGNPKTSLPIGDDEHFIINSWETATSLLSSFQPNRLIYFIQKDERQDCTSEQDKELYNQIIVNASIKLIFEKKFLYDNFISDGINNIPDHGAWFQPPGQSDNWTTALAQILNQFESKK